MLAERRHCGAPSEEAGGSRGDWVGLLSEMSSFLRAVLLSTMLGGCLPAAFPRSGEVAPRGDFSAEVSLQAVAFEPQRVPIERRTLTSKVAFFPAIGGAVRASLGHCEVGGFYALTRIGPEARCGLLSERRGSPLSVALSGSGGIDYGAHFGAYGRLGLDVSRHAGPITAIVDAYLSTADELRYIGDPANPPIEGPFPGHQSTLRREIRLTLPVGIGFDVAKNETRRFTLVVGTTPYFLLVKGACKDDPCKTPIWDGDRGAGITVGLEVHPR